MCLKIDAKYPVLMGHGLAWFFVFVMGGWVGCVLDGFPLVVECDGLPLLWGWVVSVLQSEIIYGSGRCLIPGGGWGFFCGLVSNAFRGVDQAFTESLILAQDERWRRA